MSSNIYSFYYLKEDFNIDVMNDQDRIFMPSRLFDLLFEDDGFVLVLLVRLFMVVVESSSVNSSTGISSGSRFVSLSRSAEGFNRFSFCVR